MRRLGVLLVALAAPACSPGSSSSDVPSAPSSVSLTAAARAILDLTNEERTRAGLPPLQPDARLVEAARIHADQMVEAGRLDHVLPGARYPTLQDRVENVGYRWQALGENLAYGQAGAAAVVADWMRSAAHRDNLLNPAFTDLGIAHADDPAGRRYFAQVFARPR